MARPRRPLRNTAARSWCADVRRFFRLINADEVFGTHKGQGEWLAVSHHFVRRNASFSSTCGCARTGADEDRGSPYRMIAIVRIALRRPYTFVVLALVILIVGPLAALRTPVDIFPDIRIPVIAIIWQYTGLQPDLMAGRITTQAQRGLTTTVNDIEHIEATSYNGLGIIKV